MANLALETWLRFLIWLVLGLVVYTFYGRHNSILGRDGKNARDSVKV